MALAATYSSIRQRTSGDITVHVIADDSVTRKTRRRLRSSMQAGDRLRFHSAEAVPEAHQLAMQLDGHFSPAIVWRAWIPDYLPKLKRCILLDCDLQVLLDIRRIWTLDLQGNCLSAFQGGKPHPPAYYDWLRTSRDRYFRMCVCLMNLRRLRRNKSFINSRYHFLLEAEEKRSLIPQAGLLEQSLFNRFFSNDYLPLPFPLVPANRLDHHPERRIWINKMLLNHEPMILDLKGWLNQSSLSLSFWTSLLHTPWWECAKQQQLKPPEPPQSPT
ncbi:hypothetical protein N9U66_00135 [Synechococcus sp. AH-736-M20]|nr:hypothetical protein [Synechococcus sp. AH-736-M20]